MSNDHMLECDPLFMKTTCITTIYFCLIVNVKWGKEKFSDVECNTDEPPMVFKAQIFALSGVQPDRQKIMIKGAVVKVVEILYFSTMDDKHSKLICFNVNWITKWTWNFLFYLCFSFESDLAICNDILWRNIASCTQFCKPWQGLIFFTIKTFIENGDMYLIENNSFFKQDDDWGNVKLKDVSKLAMFYKKCLLMAWTLIYWSSDLTVILQSWSLKVIPQSWFFFFLYE